MFPPNLADRLHVGIIMDGNGRWAVAHGMSRYEGHRMGAKIVRQIVRVAPDCGVRTLTLYAFSSENWNRPPDEVSVLMSLFDRYLRREAVECASEGVQISVLGRRDRFSNRLRSAIDEAEHMTKGGDRLHLRIALDYSSRDTILMAALQLASSTEKTPNLFSSLIAGTDTDGTPVSDVDLIIRTGGEQRLSDFLLWECAYAELLFTDTMWPEFDEHEFRRAIEEFHSRDRRFGRVPNAVERNRTGNRYDASPRETSRRQKSPA